MSCPLDVPISLLAFGEMNHLSQTRSQDVYTTSIGRELKKTKQNFFLLHDSHFSKGKCNVVSLWQKSKLLAWDSIALLENFVVKQDFIWRCSKAYSER